MYFATGKRNGKSEGGLSLDAVVAECAQVIQNSAITVAGIREDTRHINDTLRMENMKKR